jgi:hypothetical protein
LILDSTKELKFPVFALPEPSDLLSSSTLGRFSLIIGEALRLAKVFELKPPSVPKVLSSLKVG